MKPAHENQITGIYQDVVSYKELLTKQFDFINFDFLVLLENAIADSVSGSSQLFICGNGGSAANANHAAVDLIYGISKKLGVGAKCYSLCSNEAITYCLSNDEGFDKVFTYQLGTLANQKDNLLVLSGSGNSPNIISALKYAKNNGLTSFAILGFDGGVAKDLADHVLHLENSDMQVSEDMQIILIHILAKRLFQRLSNSD